MTPSSISHYRVVRELGAGGMGVVYLAEDPRLGRRVAIKVLPPHLTSRPDRVRRFEQEARAASALNHPNIITVYDIGDCGDGRFIVTELIDGETLREMISRRGIPLAQKLRVAAQVADALAAAHAVGVIHRDIKPENIMIRRDGYVKVLDFGLAKLTEVPQHAIDEDAPTQARMETEAGVVMGTVSYMSPEQARGIAVDATTDIFSLGVVLYEWIAGQRPFRGSTSADVVASILNSEPPPLSRTAGDIPPELERIVARALAKDRNERYPDARQLADDLRHLGQRLDAAPNVTGTMEPAIDRPSHSRRAIAVATGAAALLLVVAAIAWSRFVRTPETIDTLAVLPFVNASRDADAEYLSDGITESLINNLSQLPHLKVRSRSAVWRYKSAGAVVDPQKAARDLDVRAVLVGHIARAGNRLAISTELIDARDNSQLWGERYDRASQEVLAVQEEIAGSIVDNLRVRLTGDDKRLLAKRHTQNTEAYERYLRGRYFLNRRSVDAIRKGKEFFEQAIDLDPAYALAYSGLSDSYALLAAQAAMAPGEAYPAALSAARKAIELDPSLAEGHASLAHASFHEDDLATAEREFTRAIELRPSYFLAWQWKSEYLNNAGRRAEALDAARRAVSLEPLDLAANAQVGLMLYSLGRYEEAIAQSRKTLEIDPQYFNSHSHLGMIYLSMRRYPEAIAEFRETERLTDGRRGTAGLALAYARSGKETEARSVIAGLEARAKEQYLDSMDVARAYAALGERDGTLRWLARARDDGRSLSGLAASEDFAFLREDPRFTSLTQTSPH